MVKYLIDKIAKLLTPQNFEKVETSLVDEYNNEICKICFKQIANTDNEETLGCDESHKFHENCLWFYLKFWNYCPICNKTLEDEDVVRLRSTFELTKTSVNK